jgi:hypothetical protein
VAKATPIETVPPNPRAMLNDSGRQDWAINGMVETLDAKAPGEEIKSGHNVEQVYSYAIHPEIRVELFALCNGQEFILFDIHQKEPVLYFHLSELRHYWEDVQKYLAPVKAATQLPKRLRNPSGSAKATQPGDTVLDPF